MIAFLLYIIRDVYTIYVPDIICITKYSDSSLGTSSIAV